MAALIIQRPDTQQGHCGTAPDTRPAVQTSAVCLILLRPLSTRVVAEVQLRLPADVQASMHSSKGQTAMCEWSSHDWFKTWQVTSWEMVPHMATFVPCWTKDVPATAS
jgi:hypothetical protein